LRAWWWQCCWSWSSSNKLEKLLHLVGWFIWIFDDARTYRLQESSFFGIPNGFVLTHTYTYMCVRVCLCVWNYAHAPSQYRLTRNTIWETVPNHHTIRHTPTHTHTHHLHIWSDVCGHKIHGVLLHKSLYCGQHRHF
jgi:hypothetical protein